MIWILVVWVATRALESDGAGFHGFADAGQGVVSSRWHRVLALPSLPQLSRPDPRPLPPSIVGIGDSTPIGRSATLRAEGGVLDKGARDEYEQHPTRQLSPRTSEPWIDGPGAEIVVHRRRRRALARTDVMMFPLLLAAAHAEGLAIRDGELANEHLSLELTAAQVSALAGPACPAEDLVLNAEQRAWILARTGKALTWIDARPQACWTDCVCGESNLGLVHGTRVSVELSRLMPLRLSASLLRRFRTSFDPDPVFHPMTVLHGDDAPLTPAELDADARLRASAARLVDPVGVVVNDALGAYPALAIELPVGASQARIRHAGGDLSGLVENVIRLPLRRSEIEVTPVARTGSVRWPDSAVLPDRVLLATVCSHEADGDYPCWMDLRYAGDHLVAALQIDPSQEAPVFSAEWSGETLQRARASGPGESWTRWGVIESGAGR